MLRPKPADGLLAHIRTETCPKQNRRAVNGGKRTTISVKLKVVTPIYGGGYRTRELDDVDIIRVPTIRGHLRFWWRALYGHTFVDAVGNPSAAELYKAEAALWGRAGDDNGGRSSVEVRVSRATIGTVDPADIVPATRGSYALFPAKSQNADAATNTPAVPVGKRRTGNIEFELLLTCLKSDEPKIRKTIRAWILFGGYGGRTRRGLGSLTALTDADRWLPSLDALPAEVAALTPLLRHQYSEELNDALPELSRLASKALFPSLNGSALLVKFEMDQENGEIGTTADEAWIDAVGWLNKFRQKPSFGARLGSDNAPSISNWPEPDKIRHIRHRYGHPARAAHGNSPAWPRAGFGLPIVGEFGGHGEPRPFELRWKSCAGEHSRLASPLILKALPLANGRFIACALWLSRTLPDDAEVGLAIDVTVQGQSVRIVEPGTEAPFERPGTPHPLLANGDTPAFFPLHSKVTLRNAFADWLKRSGLATEVSP